LIRAVPELMMEFFLPDISVCYRSASIVFAKLLEWPGLLFVWFLLMSENSLDC